MCRSRLINASNSRWRNLLRVNSSDDGSSEMKSSPGSLETIAALRELNTLNLVTIMPAIYYAHNVALTLQ